VLRFVFAHGMVGIEQHPVDERVGEDGQVRSGSRGIDVREPASQRTPRTALIWTR
jgi:hypothetical protein